MKRTSVMVFFLVLMLVLVPGCKKKGPPVAGKAIATDLVRMLPENPLIILSFDIHKLASLPFFDQMIAESEKEKKEGEVFANYKDFVDKTGIDLKKDAYFITVGLYGNLDSPGQDMDVSGVANLRVDKEKVLRLMKEKNVALLEETYGGLTIYGVEEKEPSKGKAFRFAFVDASNVVFGTPGKIKAGIDLFSGKGKNAYGSGKTKEYLGKINSSAIFWLVLGNIPDSVKKQAAANGMFQLDLSKAEALLAFFDFNNKILSGELQLLNPNEQANKQIADTLNGLKGLAGMGSQENPEIGELVNAITLSSSKENIKLALSIPEALLNKLVEKAKQKAQTMMPQTPQTEQPTESKIQESAEK